MSNSERPISVDLESERHRISPSLIEARILEQGTKPGETLEVLAPSGKLPDGKLTEALNSYLETRFRLLGRIKRFGEIKDLVETIFERYEVVKIAIKARKIQTPQPPSPKKTPSFLEALNRASKRETQLGSEVRHLVLTYGTLLRTALEMRTELEPRLLNDFLARICSFDVEWMSADALVGDESSIAIPLDFHPSRLPIALLPRDALEREKLRYPPLFLSYRDPPRLMKPYRSLDGHPIMIRVPTLLPEFAPEAEIGKTKTVIGHSVGPLVRHLKGLFGRRETSPKLVKKALVTIIDTYLGHNPMSVDRLKVLDLGCGLGDLSRTIYIELLRTSSYAADLFIETVLNDIQDEPGIVLRSLARYEEYREHLECRMAQGDMEELIANLAENKERFDILFANRVFDMYGNYMIDGFSKTPADDDEALSGRYDERSPKTYTGTSSVLAFTETGQHQELWRAFRYRLGRGEFDINPDPTIRYLPSVEMNVLKNAFGKKPEEWEKTFVSLVDLAEVSVVTVFPGTLKTLFPIPQLDQLGIHSFEKIDEVRSHLYTVVCLTRDKKLKEKLEAKVNACLATDTKT